MSLWDTLKGPSPDLKGKTPFTPYSGYTPSIWFLLTIPLPGSGIPPRTPHGTVIDESRQYHLKSDGDG